MFAKDVGTNVLCPIISLPWGNEDENIAAFPISVMNNCETMFYDKNVCSLKFFFQRNYSLLWEIEKLKIQSILLCSEDLS